MAISKVVYNALVYAAQKGKLDRVGEFAPMLKKSGYSAKQLSDIFVGMRKQNLTPIFDTPLTLDSMNKAAMEFAKIREAQAKGIDANLIQFT